MPRNIAHLRLAAQRIADPTGTGPAAVVRWLTAVQAQDFPGAMTSVALRIRKGTSQQVLDALNSGAIVRSWPMRGTLHFVAAEDLGWLLRTTAVRAVDMMARRREELGLDEVFIERGRSIAVDALSGGRSLSRTELTELWKEAGLLEVRERGYHLIGYLAMTGVLCFGPVRDKEQLLVLIDDWIGNPRHLDRQDALGELAVRYFRSHGPATVKDFAWWTKLLAADVKTAMEPAREQLESRTYDGVEYLMAAETAEFAIPPAAGGVFLLPGFDEYLLGYQNRSAVLDEAYADRIVPGGNGVFRPTVVVNGRVAGTWKHGGTKGKRRIETTSFTKPFSATKVQQIERRYKTLT